MSGTRRRNRFRRSRPAYSRQNFTTDELIDFTPQLREEALKLVTKFKLANLYNPPTISRPEGPIKILTFATALGGTNWPGGSYDPETHTVYASANQQIVGLGLLPVTDPRFSDSTFVGGDVLAGLRDVQGHSGDGPRLNGGKTPANLPSRPGNPSPQPGMGAGFLSSPDRSGPAHQQAAVWRHLCGQSGSRGARLDRCRTATRQTKCAIIRR